MKEYRHKYLYLECLELHELFLFRNLKHSHLEIPSICAGCMDKFSLTMSPFHDSVHRIAKVRQSFNLAKLVGCL